jgi:general secretion pathway protein G
MILRRLERKAPRPAFTLMEMMVVIAIIVLLAGLGAWSYMSYLERARQDKGHLDCIHIQEAVEQYQRDVGDYPDNLTVLTQPLEGKPAYLKEEEIKDPWGQLYVYEKETRHPTQFYPRVSSAHQTGGKAIANWNP